MKIKLAIISILMLILVQSVVLGATENAYIRTTFLNQDPDPANPGKYVELRWTVEKLGTDTLTDVTFELELDYPFSFDPSDVAVKKINRWFGTSDEDSYYNLYYKIRVDENAIEDTYNVRLKSKASQDSGWVTEEYLIRVGEKEISQFVLGTLQSSPTKLVSDIEEAELSVEIQNIGDGNSENVIVTLNLPDGFSPTYGYSDRYNLGLIEAGSSKIAKFYVDTDENLVGGLYEAELVIQYKEADDSDNIYKTFTMPLELPVKDSASFIIESVEFIPETFGAGESVDVKIKIKNTGGEDAESVSIKAYKESSQPFEFIEKSDFIGNIKPNDSAEAILSFDVDKDASAKEYLLDLEIRSIDGSEVKIDDKSIDLIINESNQTDALSKLMPMIITIVLIALAGFIGYRLGKNKE